MSQQTYSIGGKKFTLKGYTHETEQRFQQEAPEIEARLDAGQIDRFEYYKGLFELILDGPVDELNPHEDIEARQAEQIVMDFMPPSIQLMNALNGYLKS